MIPGDIQLLGDSRLMSGFTLVEALVAMTIFTIGFSGLYFFYGFSQQAIVDAEKRMHLNLMGERIIQTITAEAQRPSTDPLNIFNNNNFDQYRGSLNDCSAYSAADIRREWCDGLTVSIGPLGPNENREVLIQRDSAGLIVDVTLITGRGAVSAYFSRKLRQI